jgi:hypothetical protein
MSICFDHSQPTYLYTCPGLLPSGSFKVGQSTNITFSLLNTGTLGRNVTIHLWWIGPNMTPAAGPQLDLVNSNRLVLPYSFTHPIYFGVAPGGSSFTVAWIPNAADFPGATLGGSVPGFLFAQAEVQALSFPALPGDSSALNNWSPAYVLCAQHNIEIDT